MWKKILVMLLAFCGTYACFMQFDQLKAESSPYHVFGTITARIHKAPQGITNPSFGLQKGDKVYMGVENTAQTTPYLEWQLLRKDTYTDYGCIVYNQNKKPVEQLCNKPEISSWYSLMTQDIGKTHAGFQEGDFYEPENLKASDWHHIKKAPYVNSPTIIPMLSSLQQKIDASPNDYKILSYRNLTYAHSLYKNPVGTSNADEANIKDSVLLASLAISESYNDLNRNIFLLPYEEMYWGVSNIPKLPSYDRAFSSRYFISYFTDDPGFGEIGRFFAASVGTDGTIDTNDFGSYSATNSNYKASVRPASYLNFDDVVFGVSQGDDSSTQTIVNTTLPQTYSSILQATQDYKGMKLRVENKTLTDTTILSQIRDNTARDISQVTRGSYVELCVIAKPGSTGNGVNTVSALIFDENNQLVYYQPLGVAKGMASYPLDTSAMKIGKYKIGIVNEAYNELSYSPADSSAITDLKPLEILPELHVTVTNTPQNQESYEYSKNVNYGDQVAIVSTKAVIDGIEYPKTGIEPITYQIKASSDTTHANDMNFFEIKEDAYGNVSIVVKERNGLDAGTYEFSLYAYDRNRQPIQADGTWGTTIPVCIVVEPTELTLAFDHPETTRKSIQDARFSWMETAHTNTTSSPVQISYSISGGDVGLINYYATGSVGYKGDHEYGVVRIKAAADDHPMTKKNNYKTAFVEKDIVIYRNVDGYVTPDDTSSSPITPTFHGTDASVKQGGSIGIIHGTKGTPDAIGSDTITYTYGLKEDAYDANYFAVNASTGQITSTANLSKGSYQITVTIQDQWSVKELDVMIHVDLANCEDLRFYESSTSDTMITEKEVKYTDRNVSVFATVKHSDNSNPVEYSIRGGGNEVISIHPVSGAIEIHGTGTITIIATKKGISGQADARADLTFTVLASEQAFKYVDASGNELPKAGIAYEPYVKEYCKACTFQLYTSGVSADSVVTYQLKQGSPTDVVKVDEDGLVHILNASLIEQLDSVRVVATSHDPTGVFEDQSIELPIQITKAKQELAFGEVIYVENGSGSIHPVIKQQDIGSHDGGVLVLNSEYYISIPVHRTDASVSTKDGKRINYEYLGDETITVALHVEKAGNRNYEKAEADGLMKLLGPNEAALSLQGPDAVTYGDHFEVSSLQADTESTAVSYQFEVMDNAYVSEPMAHGKKAEFDAIHVSGNDVAIVTVTRRAEGEITLSKSLSIRVLPKNITIQMNDQTKQQGEKNPVLTYEDFTPHLVSWNGVKDVIDQSSIKPHTSAAQTSPIGRYPISADIMDLQKRYPNYEFSVQQGILTILGDYVQKGYKLELQDGKQTLYDHTWTKHDVAIKPTESNTALSIDQREWDNELIISKEGEQLVEFWLRNDIDAAIAKHQENIKIDKTPPKILQVTMHCPQGEEQLLVPNTQYEVTSFGSFNVKTSDINQKINVSKTANLRYTLYDPNNEIILESYAKVHDEASSFSLTQPNGEYQLCLRAVDHAENESEDTCISLRFNEQGKGSDEDKGDQNQGDNNDDNKTDQDDLNHGNNANDKPNDDSFHQDQNQDMDQTKQQDKPYNNDQKQDDLTSVKGITSKYAGGLTTGVEATLLFWLLCFCAAIGILSCLKRRWKR